jgi:hypothetical protein
MEREQIKQAVRQLIERWRKFPDDDPAERVVYRDGDEICFHQRVSKATCVIGGAGLLLD